MRAILLLASAVALTAACSDPPAPTTPATALTVAPEPAQITSDNADAAADALEKEIAADAD